MNDKPHGPDDLGQPKVPAVVPAGQHDRRGSGQVLMLDGAGRSGPKKHVGFVVTPGKLKEALVYRWKLALAVGLILACGGVGLAFATYKPKFTAFTSMRVVFNKQNFLPGAPNDTDRNLDKRQKNEIQIVKSREILSKVVLRDEIRPLEAIRNAENPVGWLEKELQASFVPGTDFFRISLSGEDPNGIATIVNGVRKEYIEQYKVATNSEQNQQIKSIDKIMKLSQEKINEERKGLAKLLDKFITTEAEVLIHKAKLAVDELGSARRELYNLEATIRPNEALLKVQMLELSQIKSPSRFWISAAGPAAGPAIAEILAGVEKLPVGFVEELLDGEPRVQQAKIDIRKTENQITEYKKSFTATTPRLMQLEESLEKARIDLEKVKFDVMPDVARKIRDRRLFQVSKSLELTQEKLAVAQEQKKEIINILRKLEGESKLLGVGTFAIGEHRRTIAEQEALLKTLGTAKERLDFEMTSESYLVFHVQDADPPSVNQASLFKTGSLYALGGLLIGLLGVSFFEARLHRVHRSDQVDQELGIQLLGVLPILAQKDSRSYGAAEVANETIPDVMFADAVNNLCARLLCDDRLTSNSVVMVTSAAENEGKTMLATQLTAGLARCGRRTLLLDCDFRNSRCHEQFGLPAGPGLGEVLCGEVELANVLQTVPETDARFLMAGKSNSQVIKALNNGKFAALLARFRKEYDYVIVDTAPTPVVSDGLLVGKLSDGVILVVRPKVSKSADVVAAFEQLASLKIPILGSVVNANLPWVSSRYYKKS